MRSLLFVSMALLFTGCTQPPPGPRLTVELDLIEACSCPLFCQCFLGRMPAKQDAAGNCYCRFNTAFRVVRGRWGETSLDGAKFWVAGDLGACTTQEREWAVLVFDQETSPAQRQGIRAFVDRLYPFPWRSLETTEAEIGWEASEDGASASLDGGLTGGLDLTLLPAARDPGRPVLLENLPYMRTQSNDGFHLMPCRRAWFRAGNAPFEIGDCNGFRIRVRMDTDEPLPERSFGM